MASAVALRDTWGSNGHRRRRIDLPDFYALGGREGLRAEAPDRALYRSPHYESASMAAMGLASMLSGDSSFVETVVEGIDDYLSQWPEGIMFQHSENDDTSKFVIALLFCGAALSEDRYFTAAAKLLEPFIDAQLPCGAIPDIDRSANRYGKNRSNADYGTFESSLFQHSGDLVTDQVYGSSFMLLALYAAKKLLGTPVYERSLLSLADYLVRIQLRETGRAFLDGGWMRAFDPIRWEYFGAAGDWGYGPYLLETGWCQAIIDIGLSWIVTGTELDLRNHPMRDEFRCAAETSSAEGRRIEANWRDFTPPPVPRGERKGEPDPLV